jgi:hypothetical protein
MAPAKIVEGRGVKSANEDIRNRAEEFGREQQCKFS